MHFAIFREILNNWQKQLHSTDNNLKRLLFVNASQKGNECDASTTKNTNAIGQRPAKAFPTYSTNHFSSSEQVHEAIRVAEWTYVCRIMNHDILQSN